MANNDEELEETMTVWVEGATGKAGRRVVEALTTAGVAVRAASRHPGEPSPGVTAVPFDWYDPTTWPSALGDADALFLKGLDTDDNAGEIATRLIASAPGVRHVVLMSAVGVDHMPAETPRRALELAVQNSGKQWTILRPNWFLQNFDEDEWCSPGRCASGMSCTPRVATTWSASSTPVTSPTQPSPC